jgi:hypothetical protein
VMYRPLKAVAPVRIRSGLHRQEPLACGKRGPGALRYFAPGATPGPHGAPVTFRSSVATAFRVTLATGSPLRAVSAGRGSFAAVGDLDDVGEPGRDVDNGRGGRAGAGAPRVRVGAGRYDAGPGRRWECSAEGDAG